MSILINPKLYIKRKSSVTLPYKVIAECLGIHLGWFIM